MKKRKNDDRAYGYTFMLPRYRTPYHRITLMGLNQDKGKSFEVGNLSVPISLPATAAYLDNNQKTKGLNFIPI